MIGVSIQTGCHDRNSVMKTLPLVTTYYYKTLLNYSYILFYGQMNIIITFMILLHKQYQTITSTLDATA